MEIKNENQNIVIKTSLNKTTFEYKIIGEIKSDNLLKIVELDETGITYEKDGEIFNKYLKTHKLSKKDICNFMLDIEELINIMDKYVFSENSLCLEFETICVKDHHLKLSIIPDCKSDFHYEFSKFLIRILRHIDVEDREALKLAYKMFVRSSKDNYLIADIFDAVKEV